MYNYRRLRLGQIGKDQTVEFAVQELSRYLKRMDPELMIDALRTERVEPAFKDIIWVGCDDSFADTLPPVQDPALDDGYCIEVKGRSGYIAATNSRSVLLAVYRFLRALGCAWVRPGTEGERIPLKLIEELNFSVKDAASYRHRGVCIEGAVSYENVADMIDYLPKVGMNCYFVQFMVPGTFFERWYHHERSNCLDPEPISREEISAMVESLEDEIVRRGLSYHKTGHGWTCEPFGIDGTSWDYTRDYGVTESVKQYLAQVNGVRELWHNVPLNTNLCYSNTEVRKTMTDAIVDYCRENSFVDVLHLWLADGWNNHCECEICRTMRPADWYVRLLNELDEKLTAAGVDTKIVFLLYRDLLWEPEKEKIQNPDRFILMFAPISRTYAENYSDALGYDGQLSPYNRNNLDIPSSLDQNIAYLRRWQAQFSGDSFCFDYHLMWAHVSDPGYEKCAKNLFCDMRDLDKIGLNGMVSCQIQRCFFPTAMPFNMMAAVLWDKHCDYDTAADAYYAEAFGKDGPLVRNYMKAVSELMCMYSAPARGRAVSPACKDYEALFAQIDGFRNVIARNLEAESPCRKEWEHLRVHSEYLRLFASSFQALDQEDIEKAKSLSAQCLDFLCREELNVQKVIEIRNTDYVLNGRRGIK